VGIASALLHSSRHPRESKSFAYLGTIARLVEAHEDGGSSPGRQACAGLHLEPLTLARSPMNPPG
jgi:hypothetical protein